MEKIEPRITRISTDREWTAVEGSIRHSGNRRLQAAFPSFPRFAWECTKTKLSYEDKVRCQAELGNEGKRTGLACSSPSGLSAQIRAIRGQVFFRISWAKAHPTGYIRMPPGRQRYSRQDASATEEHAPLLCPVSQGGWRDRIGAVQFVGHGQGDDHPGRGHEDPNAAEKQSGEVQDG